MLGGGIDSSATDLARFGSKLLGGQILTSDELDEMWTPQAGTYAYGWSTGSEDGTPVVAKDGRFGVYVTDGETNASLGKGDRVESMPPERAFELLAIRREQIAANGGPKKKPAKRAPARKKK